MPHHSRIKKLLIANRGEIARRIIRACQVLDIETVLVASSADADSWAASEAGEVVVIGEGPARESYLDGNKIIKTAISTGCCAVHPGYGFLSEDPDFAQGVLDAGLIFVGPSPASIRALGVKTTARATVSAAGVPITAGTDGGLSDELLLTEVDRVGFPVIVKAAAGGGGRGMRIARSKDELTKALPLARDEAVKNFGSSDVYVEHFLEKPRHVEVQLFGDMHGSVVHFGTRDCSSQRRHQKLLEEAPAPFLSPKTRERIHEAAVTAAKSVGYYNAGTAEFLVEGEEFFFLEINTRIQVEHPITEMITGTDLVQLQLRVAMGEPLPMKQGDIVFSGHAIELRINAEDPRENFRPSLGTITAWSRPQSIQFREDCGYRIGDSIPPFYDSLIGKVIVHAPTRADALFQAFQVLKHYRIDDVPTTTPFHAWILACRDFQENGIDIGYVERNFSADEADRANALLYLDPEHTAPEMSSSPSEEVVTEVEELPVEAVSLKIIHEPGGTFLGVPLDQNGRPLSTTLWRRSNNRTLLLKGWREEVTYPPERA